jgi:glycosyltransferase involved in cell wall biosynthesis
MPEVLGDAALLAPVHDTQAMARALRNVVEDRVVADTLREKGLARSAKFSWAKFAEQNLALYRDVLQQ